MAVVADVLSPPGATGRVVGPVRAALLVVEALWTWYRRNWRATVISSVLQPVLMLLALGLGLGSRVQPGAMTGGLPYVVYLAPAVLAASAVQNAAGESTYPVLGSFKWKRIYWGITATPITPGELLGGQLLWISLRLLFSGAAYLVVATALGAVHGPGILLSLLFAVLTGMAFGAPLVAFSASLQSEGNEFSWVFRFVVLPMVLFSGTFFPVSQLPALVRPLAWVSPLWHGTELARGAAFGTLHWWPAAGHTAYLVGLFVLGVLLARWRFLVRLAV